MTPVRSHLDGSARPEPTGADRRLIMVVDDEPDAREYMKAFLECEGYEYTHAASGTQALPLIEQRVPDLFIVDFMMPGMTGLELCEKLRSRPDTRQVPIIVFSAYPLNPESSLGLYDHAILKPADLDVLIRAIRAALAIERSPQAQHLPD